MLRQWWQSRAMLGRLLSGTLARNLRRNLKKAYCELGKLLDLLTRCRDVRGPYDIARYVQSITGYHVSGQAVSKYLYGKYHPKPEFVKAFAEAFALAPQERRALAWVYTYGSPLET